MGGAAVVVVALLLTPSAIAQEDGREIYNANCAACHQAGGAGLPGTFPPLAGNPDAADIAYVESAIRDGLSGPLEGPDGTYDGAMLPITQLSDAEIDAVVAYVATLATRDTDATVPTVTDEGDAARGEQLYRGSDLFANGGPACHACHAAGDSTHLDGSSLGPNLNGALARYGGEVGMAAVLADPPFPTMSPLFDDRALTSDEIADVTAYLATLPGEDADDGIDLLVIFGLAGLVGLIGFTVLMFRRPRPAYAKKLRSSR
jgi:mono/diheme cytochrome c family protein